VDTTGTSDGDRYEVTQAGTLSGDPSDPGVSFVVRVEAVTPGHDYGISIDAVDTATVTAGPSDTPATIAALLADEIATLAPTWTVYAGQDPAGLGLIVCEGKGAEVIDFGSNLTEEADLAFWCAVRVAMEAEETGPQQCLAGTLRSVETPAAGLEGVISTTDGRPGRDRESDEAFRARHFDQINVGGRGTPARIRAALLDQDPADRDPLDLEDVAVFNNPDSVTATISGRTLPPNSFEVVLLGDATDEQIAPVLFAQAPAGIRSVGTTTEIVDDETSGGPQDVSWTRATELYLHLAITVTRGEGFPTTGDPAGAIEAAVAADLPVVLRLGRDCYRERVRGLASCSLPGIVSVVVTADATAAPGDPPTLVGLDIEVASDEILRVDSSRITVTLV
jgi:hypothetical protein